MILAGKVQNNYYTYIDSIFRELFRQAGINGHITKCDVSLDVEHVKITGYGGLIEHAPTRSSTKLTIEADIDGLPQKMFEPKPRVFELIEKKEYSIRDIESLVNAFSMSLDEKNSKALRSDLTNWKNQVLTNKPDGMHEIKF